MRIDPPPPSRASRSPWTPERLAPWLLAAVCLLSLLWWVHPWYDPANDAAMYLLTARSIVEGEGYSLFGLPFRIRPPGTSVLLAPVIALRGMDFLALNLLVNLVGVLGCVLYYHFVRGRLGWGIAFVMALVLWTNPGFRQLANQPMSDVPGLTLLVGCLLLERRADRRRSWRTELLLGVAVGLSAYVRTVNLLLVPSIVAVRLLRRLPGPLGGDAQDRAEPWRGWLARAAALVLGAVLVQAPWSVRNAALDLPPPADQTLLYSYASGMFHEDMGDPRSPRVPWSEIFGRFPHRAGQALGTLGARMEENPPASALWPALGLLGSAVIVLFRRRASNELFLLGTVAIVSVYFGYAPRLMLPIYAMALPAAAELVRDAARFLLARVPRAAGGAARGARSLTAALLAALLVHDFAPRRGWEELAEHHRSLQLVVERMAARLEPDDVVASMRSWHYAVLLDRPVYALEFAWRRHRRAQALEDLIDKYGIDVVALSPHSSFDRAVLPYFEERYGGTLDPVARVYRVR